MLPDLLDDSPNDRNYIDATGSFRFYLLSESKQWMTRFPERAIEGRGGKLFWDKYGGPIRLVILKLIAYGNMRPPSCAIRFHHQLTIPFPSQAMKTGAQDRPI